MSLRRTLVAGACAIALAASAPSVAAVPMYDYVFNPVELSVSAAEAHCVSLGGHLTSIASKEEEAAVKAAIPASHQYVKTRKGGNLVWFWIGGTDKDTEGTWRWMDGTPFVAPKGFGSIPIINKFTDYLVANNFNDNWDQVTSLFKRTSMCKIKKNGHYCYPRDCCTSFQQFIDGEGQAIQPVAGGTVCKNGGLVWPSECTTPCSGVASTPTPPATPADTYTGLRCVPVDCCPEYRWVVNGVEYAPQPTAAGTVCKTSDDGTARMVLEADCGVCPAIRAPDVTA